MAASFSEVLDDRFASAFSQTQATPEAKLEKFDTEYQAYLQREEMYRELREELEALELPGDRLYYSLQPQYKSDCSDYSEDPECHQFLTLSS